MKDFKQYSPTQDLPDSLKDSLSALEGKSEKELLPLILAEAKRARREGKLSDAEIDDFYEKISPMMNALQKRQCRAILEELKNIRSDGGRE